MPISFYLTDDEKRLLFLIANAGGLLLPKPHLVAAVHRFGAIGLIFAVRDTPEQTRLYLTPAGKRLVEDLAEDDKL